MRLHVLQHPSDILSSRAAVVKQPADPVIADLIKDMFETMKEEGGIGLAANQVGFLHRVIVIDTSNRKGGFKTAMINPVIYKKEGEVLSPEGCLSFKDRRGNPATVKRAIKIWVTYMDEKLEFYDEELEGMTSICVQHEIDHINGITMVDVEVKEEVKNGTP